MYTRQTLSFLYFVVAALNARYTFGASVMQKCTASTTGLVVTDLQCCPWFNVLQDLRENVFRERKCGKEARAAIRLAFHDSVGLSDSLQSSGEFGGGGADGSIIAFSKIELAYPANAGLENIVRMLKIVADSWNVSYGDIVQFTGAVALTTCPGSPRLPFLAGRPQATAPAPPNLVPNPFDSADNILTRMADAGFTSDDTVALLAAHSVTRQEIMDPSSAGAPLDSTPGVFDSQFYLETLLKGRLYPGRGRVKGEVKSPLAGQFRLASDAAIARAPITACKWQSFIHDQKTMKAAFRRAMIKLANNGQDVGQLIDCSEVIPIPEERNRAVVLPKGATMADIERSCPNSPFAAMSMTTQPREKHHS